jgi:hypothetical protein
MSRTIKHPATPAPRFLPAMVIIAALIVMAGLVSLHAGAIEPAGADISHLL